MKTLLALLISALIGVVEGITEWLPISSTGHMLLLDELVGLKNYVSDAFYSFFLVAIQLGAVLAVVILYFKRLNPFSPSKTYEEKKGTWRLWLLVLIGMLPCAVIGIPLDDFFEEKLYGPIVIAITLIVYGVAFILIERLKKGKAFRIEEAGSLTLKDAALIGCFQVLSLIPGTSRSGSTILGAMLLGVSRKAAAEYSFFMAIPVMLGASLLRALKFVLSGASITSLEWGVLLVGAFVAFIVSYIAIRFLVGFVKKHSFEVFGWYRIALGAVVIVAFSILRAVA
jgi:undecaprenyl-diphosphatase